MSNNASSGSDSSNSPEPGQPDWDAIARFLAGESSAAEAVVVESWLNASPINRAMVERLNDAVTLEPPAVDVDAALARVHARMAVPERPRLVVESGGSAKTKPQFPSLLVWVSAAAAAVVAVSVVSMQRREQSPSSIVQNNAHTYATGIGQRDSISLIDGSHVILGPDSRLTVRADYGSTSRAVQLDGDAYFVVQHDPSRPFSVRVDHALIEDIGTTFDVESDARDTTTVAVISGSVRLRDAASAATSGAILQAGDRGSLTANGQVHTEAHAGGDDAAWTTGHLVFQNASLTRVAGEIRRWYGVELHVADTALLSRHVTTSFTGDEPIDQVLKILGLTLGVNVDHQGNSATLSAIHGPAPVR